MLSSSIWFSAPSFWMGGGLESSCVGRVYGADGAMRRTAPSVPYTRPTQLLSRPPPIQKLGAENHMLQLNIQFRLACSLPQLCQYRYIY